jgi:hypothetical protein
MTDPNSYPPSHLSHLVRRVEGARASDIQRDWTGNDESARNHNGVVYLNESPLRLRLSWKKSPKDPVKLIGVFDLDLRKLLAEQYVRIEPRVQGAIRLRFCHSPGDVIYIQVNMQGPALPVGKVP